MENDFPGPGLEPIAVLGRMPSSRDIMRQTWDGLSGRWLPLMGALWVAIICQGALGRIPTLGPILSLLLAGPMYVGITAFTLGIERREPPDWEKLLEGFERIARNILAFLLLVFWVVLGTLLLIVPGILWMLSYSQVFFILAEEPDLTASQALRKSRDMMRGHRMELVVLHCWQFLLALLSVFTLCIGLIWLVPFFYACWARFYSELKKMPVLSQPA